MGQLVTTGEKMTTLSVSEKVADTVDKQRRKLGLTTDNLLRKLLGMPLKERKRGRPPVKKGKSNGRIKN